MKKILVLNGPNLNMLGKRPKNYFGSLSLEQINHLIQTQAEGFEVSFYQSNHEGDLVEKIQQSLDFYAIILNPAAFTHTSVALRDALELFEGHKIEVHLSSVDEREGFRKINYIRDLCEICFSGKKHQSYLDAIEYLKNLK